MNYLYIGEISHVYREITALFGGKVGFRCEHTLNYETAWSTLEDISELAEDLGFLLADLSKTPSEGLAWIHKVKQDLRFKGLMVGVCSDVFIKEVAVKAVELRMDAYFVHPFDKDKVADFVKRLAAHSARLPARPKPPILEEEKKIMKGLCIDKRTYLELLDLHMGNLEKGAIEIAVSLEMFDPHAAHVILEDMRERAEKIGAGRLLNSLDLLDTVLFSDKKSLVDRALKNMEVQCSLFVDIARDRLRGDAT